MFQRTEKYRVMWNHVYCSFVAAAAKAALWIQEVVHTGACLCKVTSSFICCMLTLFLWLICTLSCRLLLVWTAFDCKNYVKLLLMQTSLCRNTQSYQFSEWHTDYHTHPLALLFITSSGHTCIHILSESSSHLWFSWFFFFNPKQGSKPVTFCSFSSSWFILNWCHTNINHVGGFWNQFWYQRQSICRKTDDTEDIEINT